MKKILTTLVVIAIGFVSCKKDGGSSPHATAPVVTTAALTNLNLTDSTATAGGTIVSDGGASITKSGIVWSRTNAIPTLDDAVVASTMNSGAFTVKIKGLTLNNTYYVRAFATNSIGTSFGEVVTFNTGDTTKVRFTYNGQQVEYGIVMSPTTGKKWLDRNLGAQRVATAKDDYLAYGDLFQWGRPADGHQLINWTSSNRGTLVNGTTATLATSDVPGHSNFILGAYDPVNDLAQDWRNDNNRNRWATNPQGPCPSGWHVPTVAEWNAELAANRGPGIIDDNTAYSQLKLTIAGLCLVNAPGAVSFRQVGNSGYYWSNTDHLTGFGTVSCGTDFEFGSPAQYASSSEQAKSTAISCALYT